MIAIAPSRISHRRHGIERRARVIRFIGALILSGVIAFPARAQVAASVDVESAYRFRGHSLSENHPVASADLDYDDKSGFYLGGSGTFVLTGDDPGLLVAQGDVGFAHKLGAAVAFDLGLTHSEFTHRRGADTNIHYTELYIGLSHRDLSARISYSPDYLVHGVATLYGELNFALRPLDHWSLNTHVGKLVYLANRPALAPTSGQYDWSLGVSRQLGHFDAHLALSGGGPGQDYYLASYHSRTVLTAGMSFAF